MPKCRFAEFADLDSVAGNKDVLFIDVEVSVGDGGEVGSAPLVEVGDELEGELRKLVADGGQDKRAGGRQAKGGTIKGAEDPATRGDAVLVAARKAAPDTVAQCTLFLCLAATWVTLNQVPANALAALGAVAVPEQLLGLCLRKVGRERERLYCETQDVWNMQSGARI